VLHTGKRPGIVVQMRQAEARHRLPQIQHWWMYTLALGLVLTLAVVLLFPWGASAYYVEHAGRRLDSTKPAGAATFRAAEDELWQALAWYPGNAQAYRLLAQTYEEQDQWLAAANVLAEYVALRPNDPQGYWSLALACGLVSGAELGQVSRRSCGTDEESRRTTQSWLWNKAGQSTADFARAGDLLRRGEDWPEAMAFYQRALVLNPQSVTAWQGVAEVHRARGEKENALEAYDHVVTFSSDRSLAASANAQRGKILADAGRWAEASEELAQALSLVADRGQYYLDYGWYLYRAGSPIPEARAALTKAAGMMPNNPWPHLYLANLDFVEEDYASMLAHAQMGIKVNPEQVWGWIWQSRALRNLGRQAEAEESAHRAVELAPNIAATHAELGHVLKELDHLDEAIEAYQQAVALAPDNVWHHLSLGSAYRANGQTAKSVQQYQYVLELAPDNTNAQQALRDLGY
jgi:tetratricopeptide (TPR) repeat protein